MKLTALVIGLTMLFGRQEAFSSKQSPAAIVQEPVKDLTAENMLLWQRSNGGWPKSTYNVLFDDTKESPKHPTPAKILIDYTQPPTPEQKSWPLIPGTSRMPPLIMNIPYRRSGIY
jgi:hypothetical protein